MQMGNREIGLATPIRFSYLAGLILKENILRFKKLIYRVTRGNAMTIIEDIKNTDQQALKTALKKSIYVVIFQESENLRAAITRVCDSFESEVFDLSDIPRNFLENTEKDMDECKNVFAATNAEIDRKLREFYNPGEQFYCSVLEQYRWFFHRERIVYSSLNLFKLDVSWFKGLCWCPLSKREQVDESITMLRQNKKVLCSNLKEVPKHSLDPPTYFRTNDLIGSFSQIVETYGVASYQEINPTVFTIITFPFLFGVMFGDVAHGLILLGFGFYLCMFGNYVKNRNSVISPLVAHRYLIILLGFFSTFAGFIYNEFASRPLYFGNSCYHQSINGTNGEYYRDNNNTCVYDFGMDPRWQQVGNGLRFVTSYKMKISVIIGVTHMMLGIFLSGMNKRFFKESMDFWTVFLPQLLFFVLIFGYMIAMIFIKWFVDWSGQNPPSLISQLVNWIIQGGDPGPVPLYGTGGSQRAINIIFLRIF